MINKYSNIGFSLCTGPVRVEYIKKGVVHPIFMDKRPRPTLPHTSVDIASRDSLNVGLVICTRVP